MILDKYNKLVLEGFKNHPDLKPSFPDISEFKEAYHPFIFGLLVDIFAKKEIFEANNWKLNHDLLMKTSSLKAHYLFKQNEELRIWIIEFFLIDHIRNNTLFHPVLMTEMLSHQGQWEEYFSLCFQVSGQCGIHLAQILPKSEWWLDIYRFDAHKIYNVTQIKRFLKLWRLFKPKRVKSWLESNVTFFGKSEQKIIAKVILDTLQEEDLELFENKELEFFWAKDYFQHLSFFMQGSFAKHMQQYFSKHSFLLEEQNIISKWILIINYENKRIKCDTSHILLILAPSQLEQVKHLLFLENQIEKKDKIIGLLLKNAVLNNDIIHLAQLLSLLIQHNNLYEIDLIFSDFYKNLSLSKNYQLSNDIVNEMIDAPEILLPFILKCLPFFYFSFNELNSEWIIQNLNLDIFKLPHSSEYFNEAGLMIFYHLILSVHPSKLSLLDNNMKVNRICDYFYVTKKEQNSPKYILEKILKIRTALQKEWQN